MTIRAAERTDSEVLARLSGELGYSIAVEVLGNSLAELIARDDQRVLVADEGGEVLGFIHVGRVLHLESPPFAEIFALVVTSSRRSRGLGAELLAAAESWAWRQGLGRVRVRSRMAREDAHRFYRRAGYSETKTQAVFDKQRDGSGGGR